MAADGMATDDDQAAVRVEAPAAAASTDASPVDDTPDAAAPVIGPDGLPRPASVAIVAMGTSHQDFVHGSAFLGGGRALGDEIWAINAMGGVIQHDRAFLMDPVSHVFSEAIATKSPAMRQYQKWLPKHPGPVYSTETDERCPGVVEYPLEEVLRCLGFVYMNTTVAYALGFAIWLQVPEIRLFGCDFTYPDAHAAESGRACVEYMAAVATSRGLSVQIAPSSTLMDSRVPFDQRLYAYTRSRRRPVVHAPQDGQPLRVEWVENAG